MKIFVTGDTHGKLEKVLKVFEKLKNIDLILHTGDYYDDSRVLESILNVPVIGTRGNCDGSMSSSDFRIAQTDHGNILVTHGHMQGVDYSPEKLLYLAQENECCAAVFGHTHIPYCESYDGIYLINPGSLTRPRDGSKGSYAVITTTESTFAASIIYYNNTFEKKPPKGGFVKGILNYSDRF
ncbi:MAG: metallophosphoesterase [Clostridiales bacterium]|nr:metallophosphoesterase [Clostridiales bacterium]